MAKSASQQAAPASTAHASVATAATSGSPAAAAAATPRRSCCRLPSIIEAFVLLGIVAFSAYSAYNIRLYAIETYGRIIHEFDPWFNMRATQYMADNGLEKFFKWYDHMSWYPLGRPVGTTIYPGMQMTAVAIWKVLKLKEWRTLLGLRPKMSLNDVCVFIPAWFGAVATVVLALLTREVSGSWRAAAASALVMSVIPAHIMRSVGGGYDNESVAMTAMCLTFWLWTLSLRSSRTWPIGILAGAAYAYMVAAWGGFIFVGNMVAIHAAALAALGYFSNHLWAAYSLWYIVGTAGAVQVPVVGMSPFRSVEQLGSLAVLLGLTLLAICEWVGRRRGLTWAENPRDMLSIRTTAVAVLGGVGALALAVIVPTGYFGPLSVRVRSLFIKHTRTGNPLVDSVAEHQPASTQAYWQHLHYAYFLAPLGLVLSLGSGLSGRRAYSGVQVTKWFIVLYAVIAYYFANRMQRLIILLGPVASVLAGIALAALATWVLDQVYMGFGLIGDAVFGAPKAEAAPAGKEEEAAPAPAGKKDRASSATPSKAAAAKAASKAVDPVAAHWLSGYGLAPIVPAVLAAAAAYESRPLRMARLAAAALLVAGAAHYGREFAAFSDMYAHQVSQPSIMFKARLQDGSEVMVRDYVEAYEWINKNTPADSRVLSWWDYGYQISGIANRTTLADGNTWNLEHIAMIGRILTSPEKKAHSLAKHLTDYVLVWAGNQGDDLAKSPHMARIGASVYHDVCPGDPLCRNFGFFSQGKPTPSMAASMLYKMHSNGKAGVAVNPKLFTEVYASKYGLVRIYKVLGVDMESRAWLADPANRICDAPGSWYCVGQYPPGLEGHKPPKTHRNLDYDDPNKYVEEQ